MVSSRGSNGQDDREGSIRRGRWDVRNTSVATRLALSVLLVSVTSLIITAVVGITLVQGSAEDERQGRLPAARSATAAEIEGFFAFNQNQVARLSSSEMFVDAVQEFSAAFDELPDPASAAEQREQRKRLAAYYLDDFLPVLEERRGEGVPPLTFWVRRDAGVALQDTYIASNPFPFGEKDLLTDGEDGSEWTDVHREFHPTFRDIVNRFGFVDLLLIEPETDTVVYSTAKEPDFATSLDAGPHSGSALARLVDGIEGQGRPGDVFVTDYEIYAPSLDAPASFMAAPLFNGDELVGVLAVQMSTEAINAIMTRSWREPGLGGVLGETGEIYLVGPDERMRSDSRLFLEDQAAYLERIDALEQTEAGDRKQIESQDTTILFQEVDNDAVDAAFGTDDGLLETSSYLGRDVFTAYEPLNVEGLDWVILAEQERSEVTAPVDDFRTEALILTAAFVVALTFLAVIWANALISPVRAISSALRRVRQGDLDVEVPARGAREFHELADGFNEMVSDLRMRHSQVTTATEEKRALLQSLLPSAVARAVAAGDRTLLDTVPQAAVAVIVIDGLGELVQGRSVEESREVVNALVNELDDLAGVNGLERVKVVGDTYYAACGLAAAHLDHAPRAVSFALEARAAVGPIGEAAGLKLDLSAGIHSGTVTVGLTGGSRLVYDLWGETVSTAHHLSRVARPGEILVSGETRERLPAHLVTVERDELVGDHTVWGVEVAHVTDTGGAEQ